MSKVKYIKELIRKGYEIVWITGAGVSVSAGIPLWREIKEILYLSLFNSQSVDEVENRLKEKLKQDEKWIRKNLILLDTRNENELIQRIKEEVKQLGNRRLPPEFIMTFYLKEYGLMEIRNFYEQFFRNYTISPFYSSIITLTELGIWRYYITFNMDNVIERIFDDYKKVISLSHFLRICLSVVNV